MSSKKSKKNVYQGIFLFYISKKREKERCIQDRMRKKKRYRERERMRKKIERMKMKERQK